MAVTGKPGHGWESLIPKPPVSVPPVARPLGACVVATLALHLEEIISGGVDRSSSSQLLFVMHIFFQPTQPFKIYL